MPAAPLPDAVQSLLVQARDGDDRALGRLCTLVEDGGPEAAALLALLDPMTGQARRIGFTGPPGTGKSSLLHHALTHYRSQAGRTALVAVDPSSPISGGAFLGDRLRWSVHQTAPELFLRSMGSRGSLTGLAGRTRDVVSLLDALGFARILVESAGVGQLGTAIHGTVDCVVAVLHPEAGDAVQMLKAGLLELADVYVINKKDRPGAEAIRDHLEGALEIARIARDQADMPLPPILLTSATEASGLDQLWQTLADWLTTATESGALDTRRRQQRIAQVGDLVREALLRQAAAVLESVPADDPRWAQVAARELSPGRLAGELLGE